jgi:hypothetical protein
MFGLSIDAAITRSGAAIKMGKNCKKMKREIYEALRSMQLCKIQASAVALLQLLSNSWQMVDNS